MRMGDRSAPAGRCGCRSRSTDITSRRVAHGVASMLRRAALARLRARWSGGRVELALPGGGTARLGGEGPAEARATIHDDKLFLRLVMRGELGAGEAFVAGEWSSDDLVELLRVVLRATGARGVE